MLSYATEAVKKEVKEEVGLIVHNPQFIKVSHAGATIEWDLYYFLIKDFDVSTQSLEEGEDITYDWYTFDELKSLILDNKIQEDRSVGVLLRYIIQNT